MLDSNQINHIGYEQTVSICKYIILPPLLSEISAAIEKAAENEPEKALALRVLDYCLKIIKSQLK